MKTVLGQLKSVALRITGYLSQHPKLRERIIWSVAVFLILQIYFVRELIAAEILFGVAFAVLFILGTIFYVVGAIGERGLVWAEAGGRIVAQSARSAYSILEEFSKRQFRHPHSESAR
jgi:hypothetical protein